MKLQSAIPARADGTLLIEFGETVYTFTCGADGQMVGEVDNSEHAATLLGTGNFWPAHQDDFAQAEKLLAPADEVQAPADNAPADNAPADNAVDADDEVIGQGGPVESTATTFKAPKTGKAVSKAAARTK